MTPAGKLQEELRFTLRFIREIEKEKLNYFLLAASNPQPVLLVQSPTDKDQEKVFWATNGVIEKVMREFII